MSAAIRLSLRAITGCLRCSAAQTRKRLHPLYHGTLFISSKSAGEKRQRAPRQPRLPMIKKRPSRRPQSNPRTPNEGALGREDNTRAMIRSNVATRSSRRLPGGAVTAAETETTRPIERTCWPRALTHLHCAAQGEGGKGRGYVLAPRARTTRAAAKKAEPNVERTSFPRLLERHFKFCPPVIRKNKKRTRYLKGPLGDEEEE